MKTIKLTQKELEEAFPVEMMVLVNPIQFSEISLFKLKALSTGVSEKDITEMQELITKLFKNKNK
jgi:hypothetical protein